MVVQLVPPGGFLRQYQIWLNKNKKNSRNEQQDPKKDDVEFWSILWVEKVHEKNAKLSRQIPKEQSVVGCPVGI